MVGGRPRWGGEGGAVGVAAEPGPGVRHRGAVQVNGRRWVPPLLAMNNSHTCRAEPAQQRKGAGGQPR